MFNKTHSSEERLRVWRAFRKNFPKDGTDLHVATAFKHVKPLYRSLDYYTPKTWPTPFEIVLENMLCQSGLTIVMASTLLHLGLTKTQECQLDVVTNYITGQDGLVYVYENKVYNFLPGQVVSKQFADQNSLTFFSHIILSHNLCL
jgi:hypothetical protein